MTPEEKRAMTVELATKVMGWRVEHQEHIIIAIGLDKDGLEFRRIIWRARNRISLLPFWTPTENMSDAWGLAEALVGRFPLYEVGISLEAHHQPDVVITSNQGPRRLVARASGETAPLAICRAALEAVR
jgi:hypothetical protein